MIFGLYPRKVKAWVKKAKAERRAPLEDLPVPVNLRSLSKKRRDELTTLLDDNRRITADWNHDIEMVGSLLKRLAFDDEMSTFERLGILDRLAMNWDIGFVVEYLSTQPYGQTKEALKKQITEIVNGLLFGAENGSAEDFRQLQRFLREYPGRSGREEYYPSNYPDLVERYVENPNIIDFMVGAVSLSDQAQRSNNRQFLILYYKNERQMAINNCAVSENIRIPIIEGIEQRIHKLEAEEQND